MTKYHPLFASEFITSFVHYQEIDDILINEIEWSISSDIVSVAIVPIIDVVPINKRGIVRIFILNKSEIPLNIKMMYKLCRWENELNNNRGPKNKLKKLFIQPGEVWFADIPFKSHIKQGRNFFELIVKYKHNKKKEELRTHIPFNQILPILSYREIKLSNFLGLAEKKYVNPIKINYWIYKALFSGKKYVKEPSFLPPIKFALFAISSFVAVASVYFKLADWIIYTSIGAVSTFFISLFTNIYKNEVDLLVNLGLTTKKRIGGELYIPPIMSEWFIEFSLHNNNYYFNGKKNLFAWKIKADKKLKSLILNIAKRLDIDINIVESDKEEETDWTENYLLTEKERKIEREKRRIRNERSEKNKNGISAIEVPEIGINIDSQVVSIDSSDKFNIEPKAIDLDNSFELPAEPINTSSFISDKMSAINESINPIETHFIAIDDTGTKIESHGSIKTENSSIVTNTKAIKHLSRKDK